MKKKTRIAIDGPAGAGKSTAAKLLAAKLGIDYIDTGAMYRALALKILRTGTDYTNGEELQKLLDSTKVDYVDGSVFLDGERADEYIRTPEVSELASASSAVPAVREKLSEIQSEMAKERSLVMDGRDIGTVIIKDAEYKFYLDASVKVRAKRRAKEIVSKGGTADIFEVEKDMKSRDFRDMHRPFRPLKKADDAFFIDSSDMSIEEVISLMTDYIKKRGGLLGRT